MLSETTERAPGLTDLPPVEADALLALIALCGADPRPHKIDAGVGVFRDAEGRTPILKVKGGRAAPDRSPEANLPRSAGDKRFAELLRPILLGEQPMTRESSGPTPGVAARCASASSCFGRSLAARVRVGSDLANHPPLIHSVGLTQSITYYDATTARCGSTTCEPRWVRPRRATSCGSTAAAQTAGAI